MRECVGSGRFRSDLRNCPKMGYRGPGSVRLAAMTELAKSKAFLGSYHKWVGGGGNLEAVVDVSYHASHLTRCQSPPLSSKSRIDLCGFGNTFCWLLMTA